MALTPAKIMQLVEDVSSLVVRALATSINLNLLRDPKTGVGTPVDTWFARTNWVTSILSPYAGVAGKKIYTPGRAKGQKAAGIDDGPLRDGIKSLDNHKFPQTVYITNNVDYVVDLNNGSSPQAAPDFVVRAIEKAIFKDLKKELRQRVKTL